MKRKIIIKCLNIRRIRCVLEWGQSQQITCIDNTTVYVIRIHFDITQSSEVGIHTLQTKHLKIKNPKNLKTKVSVDRFCHVPKYAHICKHIYLIFYEFFYMPFFWNKLINNFCSSCYQPTVLMHKGGDLVHLMAHTVWILCWKHSWLWGGF